MLKQDTVWNKRDFLFIIVWLLACSKWGNISDPHTIYEIYEITNDKYCI